MFSDPQKNVDQMQLTLGAVVADFGSGSGHYSRAIARSVGDKGKVYAVDVQKDLLAKLKNETAKERIFNIEVIWGDIEKLGGTRLRDGSVDAVVISNLLFQVTDKDTVLHETARVLKSKGIALVVDWTDSFGGLGPRDDAVFDKNKANELFTKNGFQADHDIDAGAHHYGVIFRKV